MINHALQSNLAIIPLRLYDGGKHLAPENINARLYRNINKYCDNFLIWSLIDGRS